jgi:undecaprenyl-diphosphatase
MVTHQTTHHFLQQSSQPLMPRPSANASRKSISKGDATFLARMKSVGTWPWSRAVYLGRREIGTLATLLLFAALTLTFGIVANKISAGDTRAFDNAVVMALRSDANPSDPLGPIWFEGAVRDITSLGSNAVLIILTLGTVGFLALSGARGAALHVLVSVGTGAILIQVLKELFGRVRPDVVPQAISEVTRSFPSGHATLAAVTYLTLGALVARVQTKPALKMYVLLVAILLTLLVGVSRIYLGVHWPTDVLAGWCLGSAWAIAYWLVAVQLQRKGQIEKGIG